MGGIILFNGEAQDGFVAGDGFFEFENNRAVFVDFAGAVIDGPAGLRIAVDGGGGREAVLLNGRLGIGQCDGFIFGVGIGGGGDFEFGEDEISIAGGAVTAGAVFGERAVGQRFEANVRNFLWIDGSFN